MKKFFSIFCLAALLGLLCSACGDNDEPDTPVTQNLVSVHVDESDLYFVFDIDKTNDKATIYMYNIQFAPRAPKMNLRVNVPASLDSDGKTYTMSGTNLVAEMDMPSAGGWIPMEDEQYQLKNLVCTVNPAAKSYSISFDAHGGHFEDSGKLQ